MGLPFGDVRLMAETGSHQPISNTITVDDLRQFDCIVSKLTDIYHKKRLKRLNAKQSTSLHLFYTQTMLIYHVNRGCVGECRNYI